MARMRCIRSEVDKVSVASQTGWLARGEWLLARRELNEAAVAFDEAEAVEEDPDRCSGGQWMVHMLRGDFELAWKQSDAIRARGGDDPHRFWRGEPLRDRRVVVRSLHGFGDAVQMLRYAPRLRDTASHVVWEVAPDLAELARCCAGVDEVATWGEDSPAKAPEWDVQLEVMELPYIYRTTVAELPGATKYVRIPDPILQAAARSMGECEGPRIGLCSTASDWDARRSVPLPELEPLLAGIDVEWWCLDRTGGTRGDERLRNVRDECGDGLMMLAAAIAQFDMVVTVDTLAAHLAGAMGKPVWLMLQHAADWRWMVNRFDSPWYPSMKLFRQQVPGDWSGVVAQVCSELNAWKKREVEG